MNKCRGPPIPWLSDMWVHGLRECLPAGLRLATWRIRIHTMAVIHCNMKASRTVCCYPIAVDVHASSAATKGCCMAYSPAEHPNCT